MYFLLFILYSCNYPDIDSVPEFISVNISMEEELDRCKIRNNFKIIKKRKYLKYYMIKKLTEEDSKLSFDTFYKEQDTIDCFKEYINLFNRL